MKHTNNISVKVSRAMWLVMAFCCVFFSGAIKKVIQQGAEQKLSRIIHTDYDPAHASTQTLKDGYREKHEVETVVVADHQQLHSFKPVPNLLSSVIVNLHAWTCSRVSYGSHEDSGDDTFPDYLLFRRINV